MQTGYDALQQSLLILEEREFTERKKRILDNWALYNGEHLGFFQRFPKESEQHFKDRPKVWENLIRPIVDTVVSFLYGKQPRRIVEPQSLLASLEEIRDHYNPMMIRAATQACVTGFVVIQVLPFNRRTGQPLRVNDKPDKTDIQIGCAVMPSEIAFPTTVFPTLDPNHLSRLLLSYTIAGGNGLPVPPDQKPGKDIPVLIDITDDHWWIYKDRKRVQSEEWPDGVNPYGLIPFQLIVAKEYPGDEVGEGFIEDLKPLQIEYNNQLSDQANTMRYHGFPIRYGPPLEKSTISPDTYWAIKNGMPQPGQLNSGMDAKILEFTYLIRQAMAECSGVPLGLLGEVQKGLGNLESELAVRLIFTRFIQNIKSLQYNFKICEQELIKKIFRMQRFYGLIDSEEPKVEVIFPEDILPTDRMRELQVMKLKRDLGLETQETQIRKLNPDATEEQIQALITELEGMPIDEAAMMETAKRMMETEAISGALRELSPPMQAVSGGMATQAQLPAEMTSATGR